MAVLVLRAVKGSPLSNAEVDANFTNIDTEVGTKSNTASPAFTGTPSGIVALKNATTEVSTSAASAPTSGQVLTATAGTTATWQTPAAGGVTSVNGLTGAITDVVVLTGAQAITGQKTFTAPILGTPASGTLTNCTDLPVAGGGTGASTLTANGILFGNGTSAVGVTTVGTATHVLTSNGSGNAPTFQAAAGGGGVTLTDDTTTNTNVFYPALATATSGSATTMSVSSTKLYYNPSTGTLNATVFNSLSDAALKTNVTTADGSIVNKLRGVEFNWIDNGRKSSGVLAQELELVLPHLVDTSESGTKSVNYMGIIGYLIESNKELAARVSALEGGV